MFATADAISSVTSGMGRRLPSEVKKDRRSLKAIRRFSSSVRVAEAMDLSKLGGLSHRWMTRH